MIELLKNIKTLLMGDEIRCKCPVNPLYPYVKEADQDNSWRYKLRDDSPVWRTVSNIGEHVVLSYYDRILEAMVFSDPNYVPPTEEQRERVRRWRQKTGLN